MIKVSDMLHTVDVDLLAYETIKLLNNRMLEQHK